tara:strand:+ start:118 stop:234 length:117 start_codon:yes stop_codon:yes gene_type:complete
MTPSIGLVDRKAKTDNGDKLTIIKMDSVLAIIINIKII